MFQLPPIPSFDALHPLIIHFPVVLLLVAPLFVLMGALLPPRKARPVLAAALLLMLLGAVTVFLAIETGEAAGKLADRTPQINAVLERHEHLAEQTRIIFAALTIAFAALVITPAVLRREPARLSTTVLPLVFLIFYGAGTVSLINTAHNGGRLVHEFGVHALVQPTTTPASPPAAARDGDD